MILYGYDSALQDSKSTQTTHEMALTLIHHLQMGGWNCQSACSIVFIAHSMGGLVLKDALVQIASTSDTRINCLLEKILGAVMFGVPNLGMEHVELQTIVEGQANEVLIEDLSRNSNYLTKLENSFAGIITRRDMLFYWAFEEVKTKTVVVSINSNLSRSWNHYL